MSKKIKKPFCTIFKRTDTEKKMWDMAKNYESYTEEMKSLRRELDELKAQQSGNDKPTTSRKKKSSNSEKESVKDESTVEENKESENKETE